MALSDVGISVAVTRQKAGSPANVCGGLELGTTKTPVTLSCADVMTVCSSCRDCRSVHGVASAGVIPIATPANRPAAEPMSRCRWRMINPPYGNGLRQHADISADSATAFGFEH